MKGGGWMQCTKVGFLLALHQPPSLVSSVGTAHWPRGSPEVPGVNPVYVVTLACVVY